MNRAALLLPNRATYKILASPLALAVVVGGLGASAPAATAAVGEVAYADQATSYDALTPSAASTLDSLGIVPGLTESAVEDGKNVTIDADQQRVAVDLGAGNSIAMTRLGAESDRAEQSGGNTVLMGTATETDTVLQAHDNAARIVEVLHDSSSPTNYSYDLDLPSGFDVLPQLDGSVVIGTETESADGQKALEIEAMVGAPWAVDADGEPVPARYELQGERLTMVLDPSIDAQYPIVADPVITGGGFRIIYPTYPVTVQLNKARTADAEDAGAAICIGIAFVPVVGAAIAAACGLHNTIIRATSRYGFCQQWAISSPKSMTVGLYKGTWCR